MSVAPPAVATPIPASSDPIGVLLVEDETLIALLLEETLTDAGYRVVSVSSASQAMTILDSGAQAFSVLVTDIRLTAGPGLTGWDIARHARRQHPALDVVYITGDGASDWIRQGVPRSLLLQKPFAPDQLIAALARLPAEARAASFPSP